MARSLQIDVNEIRSVTDFQRNAKAHITRLRKSKAPMVLTTNGAASVVVQDAATYQQLIEERDALRERERLSAAISEGIADFAAGRSRPLADARAKAEKRLGIRR